MKHFKVYSRQDALSLTKVRRFETKLGERIQVITDKTDLFEQISNTSASYILFGIPEDIGVRGNNGEGGADSTWVPFLSSFVNIQSNDFFTGDSVLLLGHFDFGDLKYLIEQNAMDPDEKTDAYRHAVITVDEEVELLAKIITSAGKIPIAIGGGHNNAYPLIKGSAKGLLKADKLQLAQINCINLDAHTDFRPSEGRHSGNGFRYAEEDGFLEKYFAVGIHENYLQQNVWLDIANNPFLDFITYEDIFIHEKKTFMQAVAHAAEFTSDNYTGVELDLDCIENVLSSAETPCGISSIHARRYLNYASSNCKVAYMHLCEGASQLTDGRKSVTTGKLISYLVSDFLKEN
ncbi:MAG: formimidoylglutamase [Chitinophagaceae bacterium]|nr:formimidoylglutamase [Chitinophagaceae bacterium]